MFKIGDFARIGLVTVRTLHHYEELGLLAPVRIDPMTGYRYYGLEQLPRLNRILALKDLGLSLDEIGLLLSQELSAKELRAILRLKQAELAAQVAETQERLARVEVRLKLIEEEGKMPDYEVILKDVAPLRVAIKHGLIPTFDQTTPTLNRLFDDVWLYVDRQGATQTSPGLDLWYDMGEGESQRNIHVAAAIPISGSLPEGEGITVETLPARRWPAWSITAALRSSAGLPGPAELDRGQRLPDRRAEPRDLPAIRARWRSGRLRHRDPVPGGEV